MDRYRVPVAGTVAAPIEISSDEGDEKKEHPASIFKSISRKRKRIDHGTEPIFIGSDDDCPLVKETPHSRIEDPWNKRRKLLGSTSDSLDVDSVDIVFDEEMEHYDDIDMTVHAWEVEPADRIMGAPRLQGERRVESYSRRPRIHTPRMPSRPLAITDALSFLSLSFASSRQRTVSLPYPHRVRLSISPFTQRFASRYNAPIFKRMYELRPAGSANTIAQSGPYLVVAANRSGDDTRNGLVVLESVTGQSIPLSFPGHAQHKDGCIYLPGQRLDVDNVDYRSLLDVQFDPARPTVFATSGGDQRRLFWNIRVSRDGSFVAKSLLEKEASQKLTGQPHHIQFSRNAAHWGEDPRSISTHAVSDSTGRIHIRYFTGQRSALDVQTRYNQQVSALCFGSQRSENMLFGGTETKLWSEPLIGNQLGFQFCPDGSIYRMRYTDSVDEVEDLCTNPQGDKLASITVNMDKTTIECKRCDRRRIVSSHTLSIYSTAGQSGRPTPTYNPNLIGEVTLPPFLPSDRSDECGAVVTTAWSPCGIQIAVARDDDSVNIFDTRFLGLSPLLTLEHTGSYPSGLRRAVNSRGVESRCCTVPKKQPEHGITGLKWVEGIQISSGLVTAGGDGTVRLWDTRQAGEYTTLATLETGIASINLGDVSKGECGLVVGDNDGLLQVFNRGIQDK